MVGARCPGGQGGRLTARPASSSQLVLIGVAGRQRDLDAGGHLGDAGGDLEQRDADGVELGIAPERQLRRQATQRQHQPVGGGVDHQAELVGGRLGAGRAIRREVQLVGFDQVLGLSARAVDLLIEMLGGAGEIGDDEAGVGALRSGLDAGDDAPGCGCRAVPASRWRHRRLRHADALSR